ncbi:hypothetical protein ACJX0J_030647, partial [Zea mays]
PFHHFFVNIVFIQEQFRASILPAGLDTDHIFKQAEAFTNQIANLELDSRTISILPAALDTDHIFKQAEANCLVYKSDTMVGQQDAGHQSASHQVGDRRIIACAAAGC